MKALTPSAHSSRKRGGVESSVPPPEKAQVLLSELTQQPHPTGSPPRKEPQEQSPGHPPALQVDRQGDKSPQAQRQEQGQSVPGVTPMGPRLDQGTSSQATGLPTYAQPPNYATGMPGMFPQGPPLGQGLNPGPNFPPFGSGMGVPGPFPHHPISIPWSRVDTPDRLQRWAAGMCPRPDLGDGYYPVGARAFSWLDLFGEEDLVQTNYLG